MNARFCRTLLLALTGLTFSGPAWASVTFPDAVKRYYDIDTLPAPGPGCTLCHRNDVGGPQTVVTSFGRALMAEGAMGTSLPNLTAALSANEDAGTDSDADGATDAEELRSSEDPNVGNGMEPPTAEALPLPQTGCSMLATQNTVPLGHVVAVAAAVLIGLGRRHRRLTVAN